MSANRIAIRYAKAIYQLVESKSVDAALCQDALDSMASLFELHDVKRILTSPVMPKDVKNSILTFALDKANAVTDVRHAAEQMVDAGRVALIPAVAECFRKIVAEAQGIIKASIKSAALLGDQQRQELKKTLEDKFSKKVTLDVTIDPAIGAGLWIGVGNSVIDLTLRTRLDALVHNATR